MSGLARILLKLNIEVSGSDCSQNSATQSLTDQGARISQGHSAANIDPATTVVFSSSIPSHNVELQQAKSLGCPLIHRSDLLQQLMTTRKSLAITGTHGKTTTSALLSVVLKLAQCDPSFMVGGILTEFGTNADCGIGDYFVAEADESDGTFLKYTPYGAIITNIGEDHLDHFGSKAKLLDSFKQFASQVTSSEHFFWCGDDRHLQQMKLPGLSYGFDDSCDLRLSHFQQHGWSCTFDITFHEHDYTNIVCALPGKHNALNAAAVFGLALTLGCDEAAIRHALREFKGVHRRCEKKGEISNILFLDDYAHHPTEFQATLSAIRHAIQERRLIAIFQPHRYSRMENCLGTFGDCFNEADEGWVTEIYEAGESPIEGWTQEAIAKEISHCRQVSQKKLAKELHRHLRPHDVVVTLGAGDITQFGANMLDFLGSHPPKKLSVGLVRGGASEEHKVSLVSAEFVEESLSSELYDVITFDIDRDGQFSFEKLSDCDVMFPMLHGPYGEDGTIQGLFEMHGIPYVGCSYRPCAIAMDKALTKQLAMMHGIRTLPFVSLTQHEWKTQKASLRNQILEELMFPVFVKGLHLGSSIGVIKVVSEESLDSAIDKVLELDTGLIVEEGIQAREIEFAVLGHDDIEVFPPGEILANGQVYDYNAKYGTDGITTTPEPDLSSELIATGCDLARRAFKAIGGDGMARIDFFLDEYDKYWLNEINPIPGFTSISLYPMLCNKHGYPPTELMHRLIILALNRHRKALRVHHGSRI